MSINLRFLQTFLACVGQTNATPSQSTVDEVVQDLILHPDALASVQTFFAQRGWDTARVTTETLRAAASNLGFIETPVRSFKDMLACLDQYAQGLVTADEAILAMQCTRIQIQAVCAHQNLPLKIHRASSLADWDDLVESRHMKADPKDLVAYIAPFSEKPNVRDISFVAIGRYVHHVPTQRCLMIVAYSDMTSELTPNDKVRVVLAGNRNQGAQHAFSVPISDLEPVPPANERLLIEQSVTSLDPDLGNPAGAGCHFVVNRFELAEDPLLDLVFLHEVSTETGAKNGLGGWARAIYVHPLGDVIEDPTYAWIRPNGKAIMDNRVEVSVIGIRHSVDAVDGYLTEVEIHYPNHPHHTWVPCSRLTPVEKKPKE